MNFLLGWPIFRGELSVSRSVPPTFVNVPPWSELSLEAVPSAWTLIPVKVEPKKKNIHQWMQPHKWKHSRIWFLVCFFSASRFAHCSLFTKKYCTFLTCFSGKAAGVIRTNASRKCRNLGVKSIAGDHIFARLLLNFQRDVLQISWDGKKTIQKISKKNHAFFLTHFCATFLTMVSSLSSLSARHQRSTWTMHLSWWKDIWKQIIKWVCGSTYNSCSWNILVT